MISHAEMLLRIGIGGVLGAIIGWERHRHGRPIGLRTHSIVALASATFMVVSAHFVYFQNYGPNDLVDVDPSRIAASVVSGIGFLAGGAILRTGLTVKGLTTAAGLWLVTAIGLATGAGMYVEAGSVTLMGFVVLTLLRRLEDKDDGVVRRRVMLVVENGTDIRSILDAMAELGGTLSNLEFEKRLDEKPRSSLTFDATLPKGVHVSDLVTRLEAHANVQRIRVTSNLT